MIDGGGCTVARPIYIYITTNDKIMFDTDHFLFLINKFEQILPCTLFTHTLYSQFIYDYSFIPKTVQTIFKKIYKP